MGERFFNSDPLTGLRRYFSYDADADTATIRTEMDSKAIEEANKAAYNSVDAKAGWKGDLHRVASIPLHIYFDLKQKGILEDEKKLKAWLNDPDNRYFRTRPGKV